MAEETVKVMQNGKVIEVPIGIWETIKGHDLASAPQSIKNLARSVGIETPKIIVLGDVPTKQTSTPSYSFDGKPIASSVSGGTIVQYEDGTIRDVPIRYDYKTKTYIQFASYQPKAYSEAPKMYSEGAPQAQKGATETSTIASGGIGPVGKTVRQSLAPHLKFLEPEPLTLGTVNQTRIERFTVAYPSALRETAKGVGRGLIFGIPDIADVVGIGITGLARDPLGTLEAGKKSILGIGGAVVGGAQELVASQTRSDVLVGAGGVIETPIASSAKGGVVSIKRDVAKEGAEYAGTLGYVGGATFATYGLGKGIGKGLELAKPKPVTVSVARTAILAKTEQGAVGTVLARSATFERYLLRQPKLRVLGELEAEVGTRAFEPGVGSRVIGTIPELEGTISETGIVRGLTATRGTLKIAEKSGKSFQYDIGQVSVLGPETGGVSPTLGVVSRGAKVQPEILPTRGLIKELPSQKPNLKITVSASETPRGFGLERGYTLDLTKELTSGLDSLPGKSPTRTLPKSATGALEQTSKELRASLREQAERALPKPAVRGTPTPSVQAGSQIRASSSQLRLNLRPSSDILQGPRTSQGIVPSLSQLERQLPRGRSLERQIFKADFGLDQAIAPKSGTLQIPEIKLGSLLKPQQAQFTIPKQALRQMPIGRTFFDVSGLKAGSYLFPTGKGGLGSMLRSFFKSAPKTAYTPSVTASILGIRSKKSKKKKSFTGLEIRPLLE